MRGPPDVKETLNEVDMPDLDRAPLCKTKAGFAQELVRTEKII
jgi:hypothetical protein